MNKTPAQGAGVSVHCGGEHDPLTPSGSDTEGPSRPYCDDIRTFLPNIDPAEYALRAKMRSLRNTASAMIARTDCSVSRQLAWIVVETATDWLYSPAQEAELEDLNRLFNRLMLTAIQAENIAQFGPGEIPIAGAVA